jgi:hypothetical protein
MNCRVPKAHKKRGETHYMRKFCLVPLHTGECFQRYYTLTQPVLHCFSELAFHIFISKSHIRKIVIKFLMQKCTQHLNQWHAWEQSFKLFKCPFSPVCYINKNWWSGDITAPWKASNTHNHHNAWPVGLSAVVSCLEANLHYCDTVNTNLKLWYSVLRSFYHSIFKYFKD